VTKIYYVLMIAVDAGTKNAVGLVKSKGPKFLIGKLTFPGGKIEPGESVKAAASREMLEEAGIEIAPEQWREVTVTETEEYALHVVAALSDKVATARQMETELIFVMNLQEHYNKALRDGRTYTPDFVPLVEKAASTLGLVLRRETDLEWVKNSRWLVYFKKAPIAELRRELKETRAVMGAIGESIELKEIEAVLKYELHSRAAKKGARARVKRQSETSGKSASR
jgi:8-oxo-dGTP pyrophosphatase MutT (NUDIX family)